MPWFAVLLFAIIPLMSLIVHTGLVILTRRQMQTVVNSAAVEGLRYRDDTTKTEMEKREQVSKLAAAVFDDDLNASSGQGNFNLGIGPNVTFEDGIALEGTNFKASRRIASAQPYSEYDLEQNLANRIHGDMVSGGYDTADSDHIEESDYARTDFDLSSEDAFLVRLRRSGETFDSGVGSAGPTVPYLFGRGPFGNANYMNRIERGTIVRATAIAHERIARTVGVHSGTLQYGVAPFWIELTSWNSLTTGTEVNFSVVSGVMSGGVVGRAVSPRVVSVGDTLPIETTLDVAIGQRYVPVFAVLPSGDRVVIGFGIADIDTSGGMLTRIPSRIADQNASTKWSSDLSSIRSGDLSSFLDAVGTQSERLLAPALVRTVR